MSVKKKIKSLTKKLCTLEKCYGYPQRPGGNAAGLFADDLVDKHYVSPMGVGSDRKEIFKQIYRQANEDWKNLDPFVKKIYLDRRKTLLDEYKQRKTDWHTVFGGSSLHLELEGIKAEISALKNNEKGETSENGENPQP